MGNTQKWSRLSLLRLALYLNEQFAEGLEVSLPL